MVNRAGLPTKVDTFAKLEMLSGEHAILLNTNTHIRVEKLCISEMATDCNGGTGFQDLSRLEGDSRLPVGAGGLLCRDFPRYFSKAFFQKQNTEL